MRYAVCSIVVAAAVMLTASTAGAQVLGTYSWQLQPFCNNLTLTLTQQGAIYTVDGFDDQCGAPQRAPLVGLATANPDGTIGFGLHIISVPGGRPVDVEARMSLTTLGGPWSDSAGNAGTFAFSARTVGQPRPTPPLSTSKLVSSGLTTAPLALPKDTNVVVRTVTLAIPAAGQVMANASGLFGLTVGSGFTQLGWCSISTGAAVETAHYMYTKTTDATSMANVPFAGSRVYPVTPGPFTLNLVCLASNTIGYPGFEITIQTAQLTALFVPS